MPAELFALATAFFFALHNVLIKKGLRYSNPATGLITSLVINMIVLWGLSLLFVPLEFLTHRGILIFVLVGLFQPGFTRFLTYKGIQTLGVAITDPIRAITPMFSALLAILFLGEQMTLPIFCATLLIIAGVTFLSHRGSSIQKIRPLYILYPLLASLLAGLSQVLRKFGMGAIPHPILGAVVTVSSSLVVALLTIWISGKRKETLLLNKECLPFFLGAGIVVSMAMVMIYYALYLGKVTVIIPIISTGPLFALSLSALFLRDVERVTSKIVVGACLIITGVLLITMWK
ncbi:MAG: EamA family transporter [Thermodesulfobacteriota bacterium]